MGQGLPVSGLCYFSSPLQPFPHTPFAALGLSVEAGLGSRACCYDLDFQAEMVPGADSQRALSLALPGRTTAGPFCLVAPGCASRNVSCRFFWGSCWPRCLAHCLCRHGACHQGWFVCSGQRRGLGIRTSGSKLTVQCLWLCLSPPPAEARIKENRFDKLAPLILQLQLRVGGAWAAVVRSKAIRLLAHLLV